MKLRLSYISDRRKTIVFVLTIWEVQMMTMYTGRLELQTSASMVWAALCSSYKNNGMYWERRGNALSSIRKKCCFL